MARNRTPAEKAAEDERTHHEVPVNPHAPTEMVGGTSGMPGFEQDEFHAQAAPVQPLPEERAAPAPPPVQQYVVVQGGMINTDGNRTDIRAGKIVDERSYDLEMLRRQGIKLAPAEPLVPLKPVEPLVPLKPVAEPEKK